MTWRGAISDTLILAGFGGIGFFMWLAWAPLVWLWIGLGTMVYGWRLGVVDASSGD